MGQSSWNLFNVALRTSGMGFFTWSVVEDLIFGDKGMSDLYEIPEDDFVHGVPVELLLSRIAVADREAIAFNIHSSIMTGGPSSAQYDVICPSGTRRSLVVFGHCWLEDDGLPSHFSGVVAMTPEVRFDAEHMTLETYCQAALKLAEDQGKELTLRYLSAALHTLSTDRRADS